MSDTKPETPVEAPETKVASPTPIFGSASTFGGASGFGGFTGIAATGSAQPKAEAEAGDEAEEAGEEECAAEFKPIVQLEEVEVSTGEEDEVASFDAKSKLYRFDSENNEWKERGIGHARVLTHKESGRARFVFRQEKTLKVRGNHVIIPGTKIQEHGGNDKSVVWSCVDFSDEVQKMELFCLRFASAERAQQFKEAYEAAAEANEKVLGADAAGADEAEEEEEQEEAGAKDAADELADSLAGAAKVSDADESAKPEEA